MRSNVRTSTVKSLACKRCLCRVRLIIDESDFPVIVPVVVETGNAAGIEMESAVAVQVGPRNPADDAQDREVVANDDDSFFGGVTLHDSIQPVPGPAGDIDEPLAAWNLNLRRLASPLLDELRVVLLDLCECQSFQCAMIKFANVGLDKHGELMMPTEELSGLSCALQIACIDPMDRFVPQRRRNLFRLADSDLIQIQVRRTLATTLQVPIRGAVTNQENFHDVPLE